MSAAQDAMLLLRWAATTSGAIEPDAIAAIGAVPQGEPVTSTPGDFYLSAARLVTLVPTLDAADRRFARSFARGKIAELARQVPLDGAGIRQWAAVLTAVEVAEAQQEIAGGGAASIVEVEEDKDDDS